MNISSRISLLILISALIVSCKSKNNLYGDEVKDPFSSGKYMTDKKTFRGSGKGQSSKDNVAEKKADIDAKAELASQVNVTMKELADAYLLQNENNNSAEVYEKFQSLSREVVNTNLADVRKVDQKKYFNGERYTVFVLYEINKKSMFKYMKKQAKTQKYVDKKTLSTIEDIIEKEISKVD
ncbi:MAG: hypothetical protein N4A46_11335 [Schleiferiaceae bacterium]|jgi:hypothetical protein|nr:hypothetical protein [Schleiferiaceae bacterium]